MRPFIAILLFFSALLFGFSGCIFVTDFESMDQEIGPDGEEDREDPVQLNQENPAEEEAGLTVSFTSTPDEITVLDGPGDLLRYELGCTPEENCALQCRHNHSSPWFDCDHELEVAVETAGDLLLEARAYRIDDPEEITAEVSHTTSVRFHFSIDLRGLSTTYSYYELGEFPLRCIDREGSSFPCRLECSWTDCSSCPEPRCTGNRLDLEIAAGVEDVTLQLKACDPDFGDHCKEETHTLTYGPPRIQQLDLIGFHHSCALLEDHSLWCWGDGSNRPFSHFFTSSLEPTRVSPYRFQEFHSGVNFHCGRDLENQIRCFGDVESGDPLYNGQPFLPPGPYRQLSAKYTRACALHEDGHLFCWGQNDHSTMGPTVYGDSYISYLSPFRRDPPDGMARWVEISVGTYFDCGIATETDDPEAQRFTYCWGRGMIGDGNSGHQLQPVPQLIETHRFQTVRAGGYHACAIGVDLEDPDQEGFFCWGYDAMGATGTTEHQPRPNRLSPSHSFQSFKISFFLNCGITENYTGFCWGSNHNREMGRPTLEEDYYHTFQLIDIAPLRVLTPGVGRVCAVHRNNHRLFCWGQGGLGLGVEGYEDEEEFLDHPREVLWPGRQ